MNTFLGKINQTQICRHLFSGMPGYIVYIVIDTVWFIVEQPSNWDRYY